MKKYERKKVEVQCDYCNNIYLKDESEVKRNQKLGRLSFCSTKCMGNNNTQYIKGIERNTSGLNPANRKDEFSNFREYLRRIKRREKECNIDLQYLKEIWEKQDGKCTYSNVDLVHPTMGKNSQIYTASVDRIDSNLGYIKGNIQFISIAMNHLKGSMTIEELEEILNILKS